MSERDKEAHDATSVRTIEMSHDRPLDALIPELAESRAPLPSTPVHQRVLEIQRGDGSWEWLLCCWQDPGGGPALHAALRPLVEATLLSTLSRPPSTDPDVLQRRWRALRFVSFEPIDQLEEAVRAFGLKETAGLREGDADRLEALRDEARQTGHEIMGAPAAVFEAAIAPPEGELGDRLREIQEMMAERLGDEVWGATPGGPSKVLASYVDQYFDTQLEPALDSVRELELIVVQRRREGVIRWIPPLVFQALCDYLGVVAAMALGAQVQWAVCEEDEHGLHPPPLLRVLASNGDMVHVPIGAHVLRWCVMPVQPGEEIPSLADWLIDQFRGL